MRDTIEEKSSPTTAISSGQDIQAHVAQSDGDITVPIRPRGEANVGPTKAVQPSSRPICRPRTQQPRPARHRRGSTATVQLPGVLVCPSLEGQQRHGHLGAACPLSLGKPLKQLGVHQWEPRWSRSAEAVGHSGTRRPPDVFPSGEMFAHRPLGDAIALGKHVHRELVLHLGDQEEPLLQGECSISP